MPDINIFAVIASVVMSMVIGSIWYSPSVLGNQWIKALGKTPLEMANYKPDMDMKKLYGIQTVVSLIGAYSLAFIIVSMGITSISSAILIGLIVSVGIVGTNAYGSTLWGHTSKDLFLINTGGNIITTVVMALILTIWQ